MNARSVLEEAARSLKDFLFPPECIACGGTVPDDLTVCSSCNEEIERRAREYNHPPRMIAGVDGVCVLLPYTDITRMLIHALKYHGMPSVGLFLGELLGKKALCCLGNDSETVLVPVPLHPSKLRERGYNQSERIARGFSSVTKFDIMEGLIGRKRETPTQTALDEDARRKNVAGAFEYTGDRPLDGQRVILVDDVLTTGSTVSECARALKDGGAGHVYVCVAATPSVGDD